MSVRVQVDTDTDIKHGDSVGQGTVNNPVI